MTKEHTHILRTLTQKRTQLISKFLKGKTSSFQLEYARMIDDYFRESFEKSVVGPRLGISKNPYAIFALGGYGRNEQFIHSDIDLLFLFKKSISSGTEDLIREIIYPLWDAGFEVGYATRSLKECVKLCGKDPEILTSLLDARFVCGMSYLFTDFKDQLRKKILNRRSGKIIDWHIENGQKRHCYFGDSAYLLEPNLKEGQGGLRDYHAMLWVARIKNEIHRPEELEHYGYLTPEEFQKLTEALTFIGNVRNHLHHLSGRRCDQLHFEFQKKLAQRLKFSSENGLRPVEIFLGTLHRHMEFIKQQYLAFIYEMAHSRRQKRKDVPEIQSGMVGLVVKKGMLNFVSSEKILEVPALLVKIFEESARLNVPLSTEAKRLVKEFSFLVDRHLKTSLSAVKSFEQVLLLSNPDSGVLNEILSTGFLEKFIPEMKAVINRIQFDTYHIYPVVRHSLRTVQEIQRFAGRQDETKDPIYSHFYNEIKQKQILLWAALLHDIGKGLAHSNHALRGAGLAREILEIKGFNPQEIDTISFLVQEHLLLKEIATRRDISDEETAVFCARKIKDAERLKMLYLLSVADAVSTGPLAWNDWSAALLKSLFLKVLRVLEKGELASSGAIASVELKKKKILSSAASASEKDAREALFKVMSPRYILSTSAEDVVAHMKLYKGLDRSEVVWNISSSDDGHTRTVTICAKDRPGFFSKIAGVFTLNGIDILDAQINTWHNDIALDIFKVHPPPDQLFEKERWAQAKKDLESVLAGTVNLSAAIDQKSFTPNMNLAGLSGRPQRVVVDNQASSFFTIIEVFAYDIPGRLFAITDVLFKNQLDVRMAKIATKVDQVVDVFYVRDFEGRKLDLPHQVSAIKTSIEEILLQPPYAKTAVG